LNEFSPAFCETESKPVFAQITEWLILWSLFGSYIVFKCNKNIPYLQPTGGQIVPRLLSKSLLLHMILYLNLFLSTFQI